MAEARIVSDPRVMMGKPCIAGTRITVELILEELAAGRSMGDLLEGHPRLTPEGIRAPGPVAPCGPTIAPASTTVPRDR